MKKKVLIGLSGGVDSAVSAYLLNKNSDFQVSAAYFNLFDPIESSTNSKSRDNSRLIADFLGIEWSELDLRKKFSGTVIKEFIEHYKSGLTPNPCVHCNQAIKSRAFWKFASSHGADFIATGHYARSIDGSLYRGIDETKDQSYFLHRLTEGQLRHTLFPVGNMKKLEVKKLAEKVGIPVVKNSESSEACFMEDLDLKEYFINKIENKTGKIIEFETGNEVGQHKGIWLYTVGQRKGLGIGGQQRPHYVVSKDPVKNEIIVSQDKSLIYSKFVSIRDLSVIGYDLNESVRENELTGKIRYGMKPVGISSIELDKNGQNAMISFASEVFAPAAGQSLVIYKSDRCLGGGIIYQNAYHAQK